VKVKVTGPYLPSGTPSLESDELEIAVGGCPAKINRSPVTWLFFLCHNLGGEDITSPAQTIGREHHGDWYKFGAKTASLKNELATDGFSNSSADGWPNTTTYPYQSDQSNWSAANNPCPAGWRLPTKEQWKAVMGITDDNSMTSDAVSTTVSGNAISSAGTWGSNLFTGFKQVGNYLFLPVAGFRHFSNGAVNDRGRNSYYWSSNAASSNAWGLNMGGGDQFTHDTGRANACSVRCVASE
jgi:uncharacterized protein (TIGR02145 family)